MEDRIIDAYQKYSNLFKIIVTGPREKMHQIALFATKPPIQIPGGTSGEMLPVAEQEQLMLNAIDVKNGLRALICRKINKTPGLYTNELETKIINNRSTLSRYGERAAIVHPGANFRVVNINGEYYLCVDYMVTVKSHLDAAQLKQLLPEFRFNKERGFYKEDGQWKPGRIEDVAGSDAIILIKDASTRLPANQFIPDIPNKTVSRILEKKGVKADFDRQIKRLGLLTVDKPPRQRMDMIVKFVAGLRETVFPIRVGECQIDIDPNPTPLIAPTFDVKTNLEEPFSAFDHEDETKRSQQILEGLTRHGSYEKPKTEINAVILTTTDKSRAMYQLAERLIYGADRYPGMVKTFGVNLRILATITTDAASEYVEECKKFLRCSDFQKTDIFIVYIPENEGKASYDSPYYEVKKLLIRNGIPSQMVDEETLANPRWKDLNISLNVFAKAGYTPWVLDQELKDADLFIGLSYSAIKRNARIDKMMAYVNVFDKYGRWKFYQGDIEKVFPYEERGKHYREIIKSSLAKYQAENPEEKIKKIHLHYNQRMGKNDRRVIDAQVRQLLPDSQTYFVHINTTHPIRLFDLSTGDGSMERKAYVITGKNQFYMCTTGNNIFQQKGMGTPRILAVTVESFQENDPTTIQAVAQHILSLTRLNWASTKNFCHEPITTKYASDISYFMTVFMDDPHFSVSERLRNKPWFL